jgi:uncharacterized alkaline shock family protein YloU
MKDQAGNAIADTQDIAVAEIPGSQYGQIQIHDDVISMIAHETAKNVPGVVELSGSLVDGIAGMIGKKDRGIRVEKENEGVLSIDLTVVLEFGVSIPEICQQLQSTVKKAVEDMTGKDIYAVNVFVSGIRCAKERIDGE